MASQGSKVLASDYNTLQTTVSNLLGTGSGVRGYGQTVSSAQVSNTNKITTTEWTNLVNDINKCVIHQGITLPRAISAPAVGNKVYYDNSSSICFAAYSSAVTAIGTNPQVFPAAGQYSGTVLANPTMTNMAWGTHNHTATLSFGSANAFRYFFNAGGRIEITPTIAGGGLSTTDASTSLDIAWQTIFNRMGTAYLYYNSSAVTNTNYTSGSGQTVTVASAVGAYQLTTAFQLLVTSTTPSGGTYYPNQYQIFAKVDVTPNPTAILYQITFSDSSLGTGSATWAIKEPVDSTITSTISYTRASGSYVSVVPPSLTTSSFT